jgi:predicted alpha/beta superfamily hydrolase
MIRTAMRTPLISMLFLLTIPSARSATLANPEQLSSITQYTLHSETLDEDRKIIVRLPDTYAGTDARDKRYPVLYLLDGKAYLEATIGVVQHLGSWNAAVQRIPDLIVVAIPNTKRTRDMTPSHMTSGPYSSGSGGAAAFRQFLEKELIPAIDGQYRTSGTRVLVGHSLAGLFVLDTFLERPDMFQGYVASDPNVTWDDNLPQRKLLARPAEFWQHESRLFIAEAKTVEWTPQEIDAHHDGISVFRNALQKSDSSIRGGYQFFEDENHLSVPLQAIYCGLLFVFDGKPGR